MRSVQIALEISIKQWHSRLTGTQAEQKVKRHILSQDYDFIEENYQCKLGEIDLIFRKANLWVFVEVKFRSDSEHGQAVEFFTPQKLQRIRRSIQWFFLEQRLNENEQEIRIDVVAIDEEEIEWIQGIIEG